MKHAWLFALLLASSATAGERCTNDGHHWIRRDQLDPALASYCHEDRFARDLAVYGSLRAVAFVATQVALGRPEQFREGNGLMASRSARLGASVALPLALAWGSRQAERTGHPSGAKWLRIFGASVMAADAAWDVRMVTSKP